MFLSANGKAGRHKSLAILGLILATLCWGGNGVAARLSVGEIAPFALSFWRWILVFWVLLPFTGRKVLAEKQVVLKYWKPLLLLAITSIASFNSLLYLAAQSTAAINIALLQIFLPFICVLLSIPLLNVLPGKGQVAGLLVAFPGLMAIVSRGDLSALVSLNFGRGDLIMMVAVSSWAFYTVLLKKFALPISGSTLFTVCVGTGVIFIFPFYMWELFHTGGFELSVANLLLLGYVAFFASIVAYMSWNFGVAQLGASQAAMFNFLIPVFSATIAIPVLGELLYSYHLIGAVLIFAGLWLSNR